MSSRSTLTPPAARNKRSNLVNPITGMAAASSPHRVPRDGAALGCPGSSKGEPDGHRALADGCGDPFGRAAADISAGEDAHAAGLEQQGSGTGLGQLAGPSPDVAAVVEVDQAVQPAGARHRAD